MAKAKEASPRDPGIAKMSARLNGAGVAEIALAVIIIAVVALLVVPLPTHLLDLLLAANLSAAVAILLVVVYVPDALRIATFPTILLLTTLFRLALNVSTSRLILLQGDAGDVIRAFGLFVVRGNYVVGAVVFLILTIVQFVVIAKGAERVAEVGARFVLDAMPGKQMAIDAELRSGAIDGNEARRRRRQLSRESQFYGAMDGAMKFVKGDIIAGLVITAVNILGGLAIGVAQKGLSVDVALKRYGLLTIGDGLVTQIPALVLSMSAGLLVTRVASEEPDTPLGRELADQLFGTPRALRMAAIFVGLLAIVPGLPTLPFVVIAIALFFASRRVVTVAEGVERGGSATQAPLSPQATKPTHKSPEFLPVVTPWSFEMSADLEPLVDNGVKTTGEDRLGLRTVTTLLRERVFADLGVPLPPPRLRLIEGLPPRHIVVALHEVPALVLAIPDEITDDEAASWVFPAVFSLLLARAADFVGLNETQSLLDKLEGLAPAVVRQVVPKPVTLQLLSDILRRLVEERVSIRDLRGILEALAIYAQQEKDPLQLAELVRSQLRRAITFRLTGGAEGLAVVLLDPIIEDTLRRAITRTAAGSFLTLAPAAARDVVSAVKRAWREADTKDAVLLTQPDIRRFVRKLVEIDLPEANVVSFAELLPEVNLRPVGRATLGE
jgi:type III secretion protein V